MATMIVETKNNLALNLLRYLESISLLRINSPSPSGDDWFDDSRNIAEVKKGIKDMKAGKILKREKSPILTELFDRYK